MSQQFCVVKEKSSFVSEAGEFLLLSASAKLEEEEEEEEVIFKKKKPRQEWDKARKFWQKKKEGWGILRRRSIEGSMNDK